MSDLELELAQAEAVLEGLAGFEVGDKVWWSNSQLPAPVWFPGVIRSNYIDSATAESDIDVRRGYELYIQIKNYGPTPVFRHELKHRSDDERS